jgi:DNA-binding phage protein
VLVRALLACGRGEPLTVELVERALSSPPAAGPFTEEFLDGDDLGALRRDLEIAWLKRRFFAAGGNMSALAEKVGITRASLYTWLTRLDVNAELWREELVRGGKRRGRRG